MGSGMVLTSSQLMELLLQGKPITHLVVEPDEETQLFHYYQDQVLSDADRVVFLIPEMTDDTIDSGASEWMIPSRYHNIDVRSWALAKCKTQQQIDRVEMEYTEYAKRDLVMLLRTFIFLVDHFRDNGIIWGVGRGSSVNSYLLYLIGVHRVDSVKYNLDIKDYLRES